MNYFATEAGQFLYGAHRYLTAAGLLRFSETWRDDAALIQTPTLHVLAHGAELLLKYRLLEGVSSQRNVAHQFGHDLHKLWEADHNDELRPFVLNWAVTSWNAAKESGRYDDDFGGDPREVLVKGLISLSQLHSREMNFALRYTCPPNTRAPRPAFLVETLGAAAEQLVLERS
jgi:hypothetical protein